VRARDRPEGQDQRDERRAGGDGVREQRQGLLAIGQAAAHDAGADDRGQEEGEYRDKLAKAGFEAIDVEPTRVYRVEDAQEFLAKAGIDAVAIAPQVDGKFMSAFVRARKPIAG